MFKEIQFDDEMFRVSPKIMFIHIKLWSLCAVKFKDSSIDICYYKKLCFSLNPKDRGANGRFLCLKLTLKTIAYGDLFLLRAKEF